VPRFPTFAGTSSSTTLWPQYKAFSSVVADPAIAMASPQVVCPLIGQTYGAVSALITALALGGVVISLLYQARDVAATRSQAIRTSQSGLLRLELEDADLMWASGAPWGAPVPVSTLVRFCRTLERRLLDCLQRISCVIEADARLRAHV
jgi:hypothetical protein